MRHDYVRGEVEAIEGRLKEAVRHGYPDVGWQGDLLLDVVFNRSTQEWQVWDTATSPPKIAVSKPHQGLREFDMIPSLCRKLALAFEPATSVAERNYKLNKAIEDDRERKQGQKRLEVVAELADALRFDLRHE